MAMFAIVFIIAYGLLVYMFNIFDVAQSQTSKTVHPTNNISYVVSGDVHNAYANFVPYINFWIYGLGVGLVVATIFIIATSIREEGG